LMLASFVNSCLASLNFFFWWIFFVIPFV
jgi:hypothetical protein